MTYSPKYLVFLTEEKSACEMLEELAPRILGVNSDVCVNYLDFDGKQDLKRNLLKKVRNWQGNAFFIVLQDKDKADCSDVKEILAGIMRQTGKEHWLIRIACGELESFYLGDLRAVAEALHIPGIARHKEKAVFRNPDTIEKPSRKLEALLQEHRHAYRKIRDSRVIGKTLSLEDGVNTSVSFSQIVRAVRKAHDTLSAT